MSKVCGHKNHDGSICGFPKVWINLTKDGITIPLCKYHYFKIKAAEKPKEKMPEERKQYLKAHKRKTTGEYALFLAIAKTRPHVCFVTGEKVNVFMPDGRLNVKCFIHVISKGSRPDLRLFDKNIVIGKPRIHDIYDKGNEQERKSLEIYPGWFKLLALHDEIQSIQMGKFKKETV